MIVPDGVLLLPLAHYIHEPFASRLMYSAQDSQQNIDNSSDTVDKGFQTLQPYLTIPVARFREFTSTQRQFLVYVEQKDWTEDWLTARLRRKVGQWRSWLWKNIAKYIWSRERDL